MYIYEETTHNYSVSHGYMLVLLTAYLGLRFSYVAL